jgi:hypothetical protein
MLRACYKCCVTYLRFSPSVVAIVDGVVVVITEVD